MEFFFGSYLKQKENKRGISMNGAEVEPHRLNGSMNYSDWLNWRSTARINQFDAW